MLIQYSNSKWSKSIQPKVITIVSQELLSFGDALREIDAKQLIKGDFILVSADVITNMDIKKALEQHKKRREVDKNCIMTMVIPRFLQCDDRLLKRLDQTIGLDLKDKNLYMYWTMRIILVFITHLLNYSQRNIF